MSFLDELTQSQQTQAESSLEKATRQYRRVALTHALSELPSESAVRRLLRDLGKLLKGRSITCNSLRLPLAVGRVTPENRLPLAVGLLDIPVSVALVEVQALETWSLHFSTGGSKRSMGTLDV